ncbi:MAG TPA: HD domain-containing phosphohydrolase, partial [Thermoanaerobaculia bacterium]|nr:HD domain-containing phosphohydrolase [Thermoanaerobaculia bacterium]
KLDDEEWRLMRRHAALSEEILSRVPVFCAMARIGGAHHERLDGRGYPRGLRGDEIEEETRIVSVADVKRLTGTTYAAANTLVARLTSLGILREVTGHTRNRRFRYDPYVRLFTDDMSEEPA